MNLLEHIVRIPALFSAGQIPIHMKDRVVTMIAVGVEYADPLTVQHGDLLILKENDVPGVAQQSGNIRCDEALAVPRAHDQRTVVPGAVQVARFVVAENAQRIAALQHSHSPNECALHVAVIQPV